MIRLKSQFDIEKLAEAGKILAGVLNELEGMVKVGTAGMELERKARRLIADAGCRPAFLNYAPGGHDPFPAALCVSVNSAVVHGIPTEKEFADRDVVGLDLGLVFEDKYFVDSARTAIAGGGSSEERRLVEVTYEALMRGIEQAQPGGKLGDIGEAIQQYVESRGFGVVRELVGHGVGYGVHEEPQVPNFGKAGTGLRMEPGLVIAIEPMVTAGDAAIKTGPDGWAVVAADGGLTAHAEHTVAVTDTGPIILTRA